MRQHRWLATSVGLALLLTTAASTTYAQVNGEQVNGQQDNSAQWNKGWWCKWVPDWCAPPPPPGGDPKPGATSELDGLLLFGFGLTGLCGYAVTRYRPRRRG